MCSPEVSYASFETHPLRELLAIGRVGWGITESIYMDFLVLQPYVSFQLPLLGQTLSFLSGTTAWWAIQREWKEFLSILFSFLEYWASGNSGAFILCLVASLIFYPLGLSELLFFLGFLFFPPLNVIYYSILQNNTNLHGSRIKYNKIGYEELLM